MATAKRKRKMRWQKFFWTDYVNEDRLKDCSWAAQGVWPRMLAIMWEATPRGHFLIDGKPPTMEQLATRWGKPIESIPPLMAELEANGVYSRTDRGVIHCRRMDREAQEQIAAESGEEPAPSEKELANQAIEQYLAAEAKDAERKAKKRQHTANWRAKKKAAAALAGMQAFEVMAAANNRSADGEKPCELVEDIVASVTQSVTKDPITPPVTVRSPPPPVTSHNLNYIKAVTALALEARSYKLEVLEPNSEKPCATEGAPLMGALGSARSDEDRGGDSFDGLRAIQRQYGSGR